MTKLKHPRIDKRTVEELFKELKRLVPHYTPEWTGTRAGLCPNGSGKALLHIFSYISGAVISRFNQVPYKNFVAFLDMLGFQLPPAQPARAPVTFTLSKGTEDEVLIPGGTQTAAGDFIFETEANLLAVPGALTQLISIDPEKDAIYLPPPGFLDRTLQQQEALSYVLVSSASKEGKSFQSDHVTGLAKGDFLKLGSGDKAEYVVIADISGNVVTLENRLEKSFAPGAAVVKLHDFALFEGRNWQEHSFYLGHTDLFNIKSKAAFNIEITQRKGSGAGLSPFDFTWEYWGEKEEEEGEEWRPLGITGDGTGGLSGGGVVKLSKDWEGEIKEKAVNEITSRWIRCRLKDSLPVTNPRTLPVFDTVLFDVTSSGAGLLPDQAFSSEIPIDLEVLKKPGGTIYPFGTEPHIYDAFAIGAKEIFSKKEATVTIDVEVAPRGILGPPAAIRIGELIKVFAAGTSGRLMKIEMDQDQYTGLAETDWRDLGFPSGDSMATDSAPAVIYDSVKKWIFVFTRTKSGKLAECFFNGEQWEWVDHGTPDDDIVFQGDPAALCDSAGLQISAFIIDTSGNLHQLYRKSDKSTMTGEWIERGTPVGTVIASSPFAAGFWKYEAYPSIYYLDVFAQGKNGKLHELKCELNHPDYKEWQELGSPAQIEPGVEVASRPFVDVFYDTAYGGYNAIVFVKGSDNQLWEYYSDQWKPTDKKVEVDSAPHGNLSWDVGEVFDGRIFVRDMDNCLWEWNKGKNDWIAHQCPPNSKLRFSPSSVSYGSKTWVFSSGTCDSILERKIEITFVVGSDQSEIWNEYKDSNETALNPSLSWQYWNSNGWVAIKNISDGTSGLLENGEISFSLPDDIAETEVVGQKNYWIQARLVGGDYGKETYSVTSTGEDGAEEQQLTSTKDSIRPPVITSLKIDYYLEEQKSPQYCLTYNNRGCMLRTEENKTGDKYYAPFTTLPEQYKTLYLGFEKYFKGGPVKIYFDARELEFTEDHKPKSLWSSSVQKGWDEMTGDDFTEAFIRPHTLEFIGGSDFSIQTNFGHGLYWLKAGIVEGTYDQMPRLKGIFPNTTTALQVETIEDEILGSGTGEYLDTGLSLTFFKRPVQEGEEVRVMETIFRREKETLQKSAPENEIPIKEVLDNDGEVIENWVLWKNVPDFLDSGADDRHYTLDRVTGEIRFGNGIHGRIPPRGDSNIKAFSYRAGGGVAGNVEADTITSLKSSIAGVDSVNNFAPADGGADNADLDQMMEIGPTRISHRGRAVTAADFEALAREASRKIAKARCLPNTNNKNQTQTGLVTVVIVPGSTDPKPFPTLQLRRTVKKYLEAHSGITVSYPQHITVTGPDYSEIGVSVLLAVTSIETATIVENAAKEKLKAFFHPLTGGPLGSGWDFGRNVPVSDIYALLEGIDGLDHVEKMALTRDRKTVTGDVVAIEENCLAANGEHTIDISLQTKQGG
ncbi:MAG: putative baseplate assembly protein [bacterium]|nr:putative baseplate assembly protein [bacterium]